jgi:hypothetical protein
MSQPIMTIGEVVEIPTPDLLISFARSYRLAYRDEIAQSNERGINPFFGGDLVVNGNTENKARMDRAGTPFQTMRFHSDTTPTHLLNMDIQ